MRGEMENEAPKKNMDNRRTFMMSHMALYSASVTSY